jgi:hypothetical protein
MGVFSKARRLPLLFCLVPLRCSSASFFLLPSSFFFSSPSLYFHTNVFVFLPLQFGAVFVAMPSSTIGGLTVFLFSSVAVAGVRILATVAWTRRDRFIATAALSFGFAAIVSPDWFEYVLCPLLPLPPPLLVEKLIAASLNRNFFTYSGSNTSLRGFLDAITLVVSEGYLICLVIGCVSLPLSSQPSRMTFFPKTDFLPFPQDPPPTPHSVRRRRSRRHRTRSSRSPHHFGRCHERRRRQLIERRRGKQVRSPSPGEP